MPAFAQPFSALRFVDNMALKLTVLAALVTIGACAIQGKKPEVGIGKLTQCTSDGQTTMGPRDW